ncbi:hypothetical protein [Rhizobium paknamense]|uniref:Uncharacterized protein n=1 Tax=Rhizobium paknamense TaxID=1206817 RepID=A0ABU0I9R4_9HYPH|nr:hypothetical protein [Rhizobium paknamense]MDQ0454220.1 hypothetical protein [Rhizobium paknamense]
MMPVAIRLTAITALMAVFAVSFSTLVLNHNRPLRHGHGGGFSAILSDNSGKAG